jgi:DNA polymerase-3 subunit gamma/tau
MATIYRKYRPQVFKEVYGQEHVLETLKKALETDRVAHAYLFTGARGVGKTTVARLLAKAVNCTDEKEKPCGKCSNCKAIAESRFIDLIEIDAASNRGIDEIRDLREKIQFAPSIGKKRVYIIDEVHMLTREAFNALLKTLEEPPEHTIFIFATTEAHKVPITVLSRCQRFDFRLASEDLVRKSLEDVAKKEGFKLDGKVVDILVRSAGGSFRDAQSLLDQLSSHLVGKKLTYEEALQILNLSSLAKIEEFISLIETKDAKLAIDFIDQLNASGVSFPDFTSGLMIELRRRLIEKIKQGLSGEFEETALQKLMKAESEMKSSPIESLPLELAVYEICFAAKSEDKHVESGIAQDQNKKAEIKKAEISKPKESGPIKEIEVPESYEPGKIVPISRDIKHAVVLEVSKENKALSALLTDLAWEGDTGEVKIIAEYLLHKNMIMNKKNLLILEKCLQSVLQCKSKVTCEIKKEEDIAEEIDSVFGEDA